MRNACAALTLLLPVLASSATGTGTAGESSRNGDWTTITTGRNKTRVAKQTPSAWAPLPCPTAAVTSEGKTTTIVANANAKAKVSGEFGVVVYGGTAGGVVAAVAASRTAREQGDNRPIALVNPTNHLGGMVCMSVMEPCFHVLTA